MRFSRYSTHLYTSYVLLSQIEKILGRLIELIEIMRKEKSFADLITEKSILDTALLDYDFKFIQKELICFLTSAYRQMEMRKNEGHIKCTLNYIFSICWLVHILNSTIRLNLLR